MKLPEDYWHTHVFVLLDAFCCHGCEARPDLSWAWEGRTADGPDDPADMFTVRAVEYLKRERWQMIDNHPLCPACVAKRGS